MSKILTETDGTFSYQADDIGVINAFDPIGSVMDAIMGPIFTDNLNSSVAKGEFTQAEAVSIALCFNDKGGKAAIGLVCQMHPELFPDDAKSGE